MTRYTRFAVPLALLLGSTPSLAAGGDLLVAPTRVVLDGSRGTEVILNNVGSTIATYRISLELRRMTKDGQLVEIAPEAANDHEKATLALISYAPRRVVLPPNQPQAIRIGARFPADLADGEYRAHMLFRAIPDAQPAQATAARPGLSIALTPIYGVTIPIIVRKGALKVAATIDGIRRCRQIGDGTVEEMPSRKGTDAICFTLHRSGDRSTYGRVRITRPGLAKPLIEARGIAAYAEISQRTVAFPLTPEQAAIITGPIKIEYLEDSDAGSGTIASADGVIR